MWAITTVVPVEARLPERPLQLEAPATVAGMPPSARYWQAPWALTLKVCEPWLRPVMNPVHWPNCWVVSDTVPS